MRNAELIRAKHLLFIMDACYGGLALTRNISAGSTRFLKDMLLRYSRQVLTAGKADEVVSDSGGPLPNHSVFTGHLIEGLLGKAKTENGILTASGLMSYVYGKVANDRNSNQTPHYGYFDGDGDFIFKAEQLKDLTRSEVKDIDNLIVIPFSEEDPSDQSTQFKLNKVKKLLAEDSSVIELHDFLIKEMLRFLSDTSEDNYRLQGPYSKEEFLERLSKYEMMSNDINSLIACLVYWAKPVHRAIIRKYFARSTDRLETKSGLNVWLYLRWYPLILAIYLSGIASVDGKRYDSLSDIFYTIMDSSKRNQNNYFIEEISKGILELNRSDVFKELPGHERYYTPMSEYLFKIIQPRLDDILFLGKNYERSFDEFEVLFALAVADIRKQKNRSVWAPIGRFGWKFNSSDDDPLSRIINEANELRQEWGPIKAGLYGGNIERFIDIADVFRKNVSGLNWW